jgi:hypothetical protein
MRRRLTELAVAAMVLTLVAIAPWSQAATDAGPVYVLGERATFQSGCFPPCLCPVLEQAPVRGTFRLTSTGYDGLFNTFAVTDVRWVVDTGGPEQIIGGSGKYKLGGEVAPVQQIDLDLVIAGNPVQHFASGLVPASTADLPGISVAVSMNNMFCHDIAIVVDAALAPAPGIPTVQRWALSALALLILIVTADLMLRRRRNH